MSPMSPGTHGDAFSGAEQVTAVVNAESTLLEAPADQSLQSVQET
uniref:DEAD-box ATP-dependent RNA helicase 46 isoform X5 n=1 Tax=Rhizophora mucronata TaxID=61149 RepID=A0A2P2K955_RHIMU